MTVTVNAAPARGLAASYAVILLPAIGLRGSYGYRKPVRPAQASVLYSWLRVAQAIGAVCRLWSARYLKPTASRDRSVPPTRPRPARHDQPAYSQVAGRSQRPIRWSRTS